jgi:hypothetical protein
MGSAPTINKTSAENRRYSAQSLTPWFVYLLLIEIIGNIFSRYRPTDFQSFYTAGYLVRTDRAHLYDLVRQMHIQQTLTSIHGYLPFYHPSYETILFVPLTWLPYRMAYPVFLALNMLMLMAAFFAAENVFSAAADWLGPRPQLMPFLFLPLLLSMQLGQDSVLSLLLYCLAWRSLTLGKDARAGLYLALALFKFQLVLPIAVLIALRRGWRFVSGFLVTSVGAVLLSVMIIGFKGAAEYVRVLAGAASAVDSNASVQQSMNVIPTAMPNLAGLLYSCGGRFLRPPILLDVLVGICGVALFVWCAYAVRRRELNVAVAIAILCGLLVNYHFYFYDVTLALLPAVLLTRKVPRMALMALLIMPVVVLGCGINWYFMMAVPLLAMLVYALTSAVKSTADYAELEHPGADVTAPASV